MASPPDPDVRLQIVPTKLWHPVNKKENPPPDQRVYFLTRGRDYKKISVRVPEQKLLDKDSTGLRQGAKQPPVFRLSLEAPDGKKIEGGDDKFTLSVKGPHKTWTKDVLNDAPLQPGKSVSKSYESLWVAGKGKRLQVPHWELEVKIKVNPFTKKKEGRTKTAYENCYVLCAEIVKPESVAGIKSTALNLMVGSATTKASTKRDVEHKQALKKADEEFMKDCCSADEESSSSAQDFEEIVDLLRSSPPPSPERNEDGLKPECSEDGNATEPDSASEADEEQAERKPVARKRKADDESNAAKVEPEPESGTEMVACDRGSAKIEAHGEAERGAELVDPTDDGDERRRLEALTKGFAATPDCVEWLKQQLPGLTAEEREGLLQAVITAREGLNDIQEALQPTPTQQGSAPQHAMDRAGGGARARAPRAGDGDGAGTGPPPRKKRRGGGRQLTRAHTL